MSDRDALAGIQSLAQVAAIGCHARHDFDGERRWLDLLHLVADAYEERARLIAEAEGRALDAVLVRADVGNEFGPSNYLLLHRIVADVRSALADRAALDSAEPTQPEEDV